MNTNFDITNIKNLIDQEIIREIILESELKNYIDINKFTKSDIDKYFIDSINIIKSKPNL